MEITITIKDTPSVTSQTPTITVTTPNVRKTPEERRKLADAIEAVLKEAYESGRRK